MSTPIAGVPGDDHLFALTALVTVGFQASCFFVAYILQVDTLTDFAGSLNFILLALLSFFMGGGVSGHTCPRPLALTILVCVSRGELGAYLLARVLRRGKDARFDAIRTSLPAFAAFWTFQAVWVWGVSLPVVFANASTMCTPPGALSASDIAGIVVFVLGFALQVVADAQKDAFRSNPANDARWCDAGVWAWSRHPNFFGEIALWWGAFILASGSFEGAPAGYATIVSPLLTMLLLLAASGIPTAEGANQLRWMKTPDQAARFTAYRARTSPLIPLPPALYAAVPLAVKRWLLFEWRSYEVPDAAGNAIVSAQRAEVSPLQGATEGGSGGGGASSAGAGGDVRLW